GSRWSSNWIHSSTAVPGASRAEVCTKRPVRERSRTMARCWRPSARISQAIRRRIRLAMRFLATTPPRVTALGRGPLPGIGRWTPALEERARLTDPEGWSRPWGTMVRSIALALLLDLLLPEAGEA